MFDFGPGTKDAIEICIGLIIIFAVFVAEIVGGQMDMEDRINKLKDMDNGTTKTKL